MPDERPSIVHVVHRFDVGGLENGLVNLINGLPDGLFKHTIVAIKDYTEFRRRLKVPVDLIALGRPEGKDFSLYGTLWKLFRRIQPDVVHTRNLATLEAQFPAWLAGVPCRLHGEHGWDMSDLHGKNRRYRNLRKLFRPFIHRYIALSRDSEAYLRSSIGVPQERIVRIMNGVDTDRFQPRSRQNECTLFPPGFVQPDSIIFATVGRLELVKDHETLVRAFARLRANHPETANKARLVLIGDGSQRVRLNRLVNEFELNQYVWLAGTRNDIDQLLPCFDVFVLPSRAEGISNTVLEAMSAGLPVVATEVGGNAELVRSGITGALVAPEDPAGLASALSVYVADPVQLREQGAQGRRVAVEEFSLQRMVQRYEAVYLDLLQQNMRSKTIRSSAA